MVSDTLVIKIKLLTTSSRLRRALIKASIAFGFYFCDHDRVARLMLSNKR